MLFLKISFMVLASFYVILLTYFCLKSGRFFKTLLLSALLGLTAFTAVNISSHYTGVALSVNAWTLGTSAVLGLPGVLGMLILRMFF